MKIRLTRHLLAALLCALCLPFSTAQAQPATFTNLNAGLPGVSGGTVAWGDYDNDGKLDFFLTGFNLDEPAHDLSQIWHNNGDGTFSNVTDTVTTNLPGMESGAVVWGDYDNDGRLDFLLTGGFSDTNFDVTEISQIWHQNSDGTFSNVTASVAAGLTGLEYSSVAWGDYDNDGRLDFLISGAHFDGFDDVKTSQIWHQNGDGTFSDVTASVASGLPAVVGGSMTWADYDNDGRLDFLLTGYDGTNALAQIWHQNGNGTFSNVTDSVAAGLPGMESDSVAWGDYDNDGRLDILLSGNDDSLGTNYTQIWRQNSNATFSNVTATAAAGLPQVDSGTVAWGDYDNDGQLDFLLTGRDITGTNDFSQIWHNNGDGTFSNVTASVVTVLPEVDASSVVWGDYDNDGRLDFLLTGFNSNLGTNFAQIWRNIGPVTNAPPAAPTGLAMTSAAYAVTLSWGSAVDDHTPASGLTYNVRAGTTPGGTDLLAANVDAGTGFRRVPAMGNAGLRHSFTLTGITNSATVYWSVQAVDSAFAGGPFAPESTAMAETNAPYVVSIVPETLNVSQYSNEVSLVVTFSEPVMNFNDYVDIIVNATNFDDGFNVEVLPPGPTNIFTIKISNFIVADGVTNATLTVQVATNSDVTDLVGLPLASSVTSDVIQVSASSYQLWAMDHGLTAGVNFHFSDDPDMDGNDNATEFMRDMDPLSGGDVLKRRMMIYNIGGTNYLTCTMPVPKGFQLIYFGSAALFTQTVFRGINALDELFASDDLASGFPHGGIQCIEVTPALDGTVAGQPDLPVLPDTHTYRTVRLSVGTQSLPQGFLLWKTLPISPP